MEKIEFIIDGLRKLAQLKGEEERLLNIASKKSAERTKALESEIYAAEAELFNHLKKLPGVSESHGEVDIGGFRSLYVPSHELHFEGKKIALNYQDKFSFFVENFQTKSFEQTKEQLLQQKKQLVYKKQGALRDNISTISKELDTLSKEKEKAEKDIVRYSKGLSKFLFKGKSASTQQKLSSINEKIEKLSKEKEELQEELTAYNDLHIMVSDEEVQQHINVIKSVFDKSRELTVEIMKMNEELRSIRSGSEYSTYNSNKQSQVKILETLLQNEFIDEVEAYANSQNADKELVEVAGEVLRSAGRGKKRVSI